MVNGKTVYLLGCSQDLADFEDGVNFTGAREQRSEGVQFSHDTAHGPLVYGGAVGYGPEQHLWGSVPGGGGGGEYFISFLTSWLKNSLFPGGVMVAPTQAEHMTLITGCAPCMSNILILTTLK